MSIKLRDDLVDAFTGEKGQKTYFHGFSRVITVASKYLLAEITIYSLRIIQRTMIFCQKAI